MNLYMGWHDSNPKRSPSVKVAEACERYTEKFGRPPTEVLCNPADAPGLETTLDVKAVNYIPRFSFYIGPGDDS